MNNIIVNSGNLKNTVVITQNNDYIVRLDNYNEKINIKVENNINSHIIIIGDNISSNIKIELLDNSSLRIDSFIINNNIKLNVNLNGENSNFEYINSFIATIDNNITLSINHNSSKTNSLVINNGYSILNSNIVLDVNGYIYKNSSGCKCNQDNKIISNSKNHSKILPNLFIDNYDVEANHSAFIGDVNEEEMFYLMSRGISKKDSYNLLIKSILLGKLSIGEELKEELSFKTLEYVRKED